MSSIMRIGGLATGMDTDNLIKQLMDSEKIRLNKFNANKQIKLWTQTAYNNVNKDIANFILDTKKDLELTRTTSTGILSSGSTSNFSWIKSATSSDTSIFTATSTANAVSGNHSIKVKEVAKGVNLGSVEAIQNSGEDKTLEQLGIGNIGAFTVNINDIQINLDSSNKLSNVVAAINVKSSETGVKASYDSNTGRLFLFTNSTGENSKIKITGDTKNLFVDSDGVGVGSSILKTNMESNGADLTSSNPSLYVGVDAEIDFDGAIGLKYSSNQFTINGVNIDLKSIPADTTKTYTVQVATDVDSAFNKIKGFVEKYNELIGKLSGKIGEKRYRDYQPLTAEQKESMKEDEVKLWEEKAQSGLLRSDENIEKILSSTRSGLYENVFDTYDSADPTNGKISGYSMLTEIGITTGTYQEKGKLKIDESKLKNAISKDPDSVINLLFKSSPSDISETDTTRALERRKESGIITRIYDDLIGGMKDIISKSGTGDNSNLYRNVKTNILMDFVTGKNLTNTGSLSLIDKDIFSIEKQISSENDRLYRKENLYYRKFAALEKAMSQMNSQSSWLSSQLGAMS